MTRKNINYFVNFRVFSWLNLFSFFGFSTLLYFPTGP